MDVDAKNWTTTLTTTEAPDTLSKANPVCHGRKDIAMSKTPGKRRKPKKP